MSSGESSVPTGRRRFLKETAASIAGTVLYSSGWPSFASGLSDPPLLRAQKLAWAGVRLQLDKATLFLDPLINPDVWGPPRRDKLIAVEPGEGDRYVLVTHRHPDHFDPLA